MLWRIGWLILIVALVTFCPRGATEHGRVVNIAAGRADQSGYL